MKKKLMILAGLFMMFQLGFSMVDIKLWIKHREKVVNSNITVEDAYGRLIDAGSIGYDFNDVYLGILLKEKNAEELLEKVFNDSKTNTGRIFALHGMYKVNNQKYQKMKGNLQGDVMLFSGCYSLPQNAKEYIEKFENIFKND